MGVLMPAFPSRKGGHATANAALAATRVRLFTPSAELVRSQDKVQDRFWMRAGKVHASRAGSSG